MSFRKPCLFGLEIVEPANAVPYRKREASRPTLEPPFEAIVYEGLWTIDYWRNSQDEESFGCEIRWTTDVAQRAEIVPASSTVRQRGSGAGRVDASWKSLGRNLGWKWRGEFKSRVGHKIRMLFGFDLEPIKVNIATVAQTSWVRGVLDSPGFLDVTFEFEHGRQLHSNSSFLSAASPYYKTLLSSGFSEVAGQVSSAQLMEHSTPPGSKKRARSSEDSDEDVDLPVPTTPPATPYRIPITETPYVTYREVLRWIHTQEIQFATLKSVRVAVGDNESETSFAQSSGFLSSPIPTSPKSVHRLADLLELPILQELALTSIISQISVTNVVQELMSEFCRLYEPVQEALIVYAAKHWAEVREGEGWKSLQERVANGDEDLPPACLKISMKLMGMLANSG
ncbi:hypothetical protein P7C70_g6946, partial [Phenoliferia sp. Uapishka_3]